MSKINSNKKSKIYDKGFTLVELLVVASIFFIITGVVLFRQAKFSSDILITNTAYEVALFIREAQVFGVGSKLSKDDVGDALGRVAYGVNINTGDLTSMIMFSDTPENNEFDFVYDENDDVSVDKLSFSRDQIISKFCLYGDAGTPQCSDELSDLNIAFIKPDLNAEIRASDGLNDNISGSSASIFIESSLRDKCRKVIVNSVGQIAVETAEIEECR